METSCPPVKQPAMFFGLPLRNNIHNQWNPRNFTPYILSRITCPGWISHPATFSFPNTDVIRAPRQGLGSQAPRALHDVVCAVDVIAKHDKHPNKDFTFFRAQHHGPQTLTSNSAWAPFGHLCSENRHHLDLYIFLTTLNISTCVTNNKNGLVIGSFRTG